MRLRQLRLRKSSTGLLAVIIYVAITALPLLTGSSLHGLASIVFLLTPWIWLIPSGGYLALGTHSFWIICIGAASLNATIVYLMFGGLRERETGVGPFYLR